MNPPNIIPTNISRHTVYGTPYVFTEFILVGLAISHDTHDSSVLIVMVRTES